MRISALRAGVTLIEMIVSLMLVLVLLTVGSLVAQRSIRTVATVSTTELRSGTLSDGRQTLIRHVSNADPAANDLRAAHDSVLDLVHTIGVATICTVRRDTIVLTAANEAFPWSSTLPRGVTADDEVRIWSDSGQRWIQRAVRTATAAAGGCGDSTDAWPGRASQRLIVEDSIAGARPGALVRVLGRERWSLVRGGDGRWSLSLATWNALSRTFSTPQPVVSPLASPTAPGGSGFAVRAIDAAGVQLDDSSLARTRAILVWVRSASQGHIGTLSDSVRINVGPH